MGPQLKHSLLQSLALALAASVATYFLAWGFFITHEEVGIPTRAALSIAAWVFPIVFVGRMIVFATKKGGERRR